MDGATQDLIKSVETQDKDLYISSVVALNKAKALRHLADRVSESGWVPAEGDCMIASHRKDDGSTWHMIRVTVSGCECRMCIGPEADRSLISSTSA